MSIVEQFDKLEKERFPSGTVEKTIYTMGCVWAIHDKNIPKFRYNWNENMKPYLSRYPTLSHLMNSRIDQVYDKSRYGGIPNSVDYILRFLCYNDCDTIVAAYPKIHNFITLDHIKTYKSIKCFDVIARNSPELCLNLIFDNTFLTENPQFLPICRKNYSNELDKEFLSHLAVNFNQIKETTIDLIFDFITIDPHILLSLNEDDYEYDQDMDDFILGVTTTYLTCIEFIIKHHQVNHKFYHLIWSMCKHDMMINWAKHINYKFFPADMKIYINSICDDYQKVLACQIKSKLFIVQRALTDICYRPGGQGYLNAKKRFEECSFKSDKI